MDERSSILCSPTFHEKFIHVYDHQGLAADSIILVERKICILNDSRGLRDVSMVLPSNRVSGNCVFSVKQQRLCSL